MQPQPTPNRSLALQQLLFFLPQTPRHGNRPERRVARGLILALLAYLLIWAVATALFGLPGFYIPALVLVPLMMLLIVRFTWG